MDGGVSSAAVEILVIQNLIDVIKQEYYLVRASLEVHFQQLQKTLVMIQAYLNDAEKKSIAQDAVKIWLWELEALAFEADNVLDEFSYHHLRENRKVPSYLLSLKNFARRRRMALKIEEINTDFESMNKRASDLGLQSMVVNAPAAAPHVSFETDSLTLDPIFIGRDDDVDKLVDLVVESPHENNLSILAIVGMGGLGKTTLTRKVFDHEKMKSRFGSLIWVHVSQTFDPIVLFKKILSNLTSSTSDEVDSREAVLKELQEALKDKTYLLVLDDVWNGDFINSISGVTSTKGNVIIMSSRKEGVASIVRPLHTHYLSGLSDEECWSIIKAKAFENGEAPSPGFEMFGREIAERCKGLPLAANLVGGLLLGCKSEEEWRFINENQLLDVEGNENILQILKLSYEHLPSPSLKKCFAYCSIFPQGSWIEKQALIEMWMAEGFLKADRRNEEMESMGDKFINLLLHNSLLLVSKRDEYGNVSHYVMHDLVHDLASFVQGSSDGITPTRYMLHVSSWGKASGIPKQVAKHLRTLVLEGNISNIVFSDFESLRVLTLIDFGAKELPSSIRKLIHLRSLNISETCIRKLPDWIGELHHLQTLRADIPWLEKLPKRTLEFFTNLNHLHIDFSRVEFYKSTPTELPAMIGRLTGLRTLHRFRVGDEKGYRIEELGSLNNLKGKLMIENLEKVDGKEEAEKANMCKKPNLIDLEFWWSEHRRGETNDESVLGGLQPHPNLKKLQIHGFKGEKFPPWSEKMAVSYGPNDAWIPLNNLIEVKLVDCSECEEIPMLGHLPNLKSLELIRLIKVKFFSSSFSNLTSLSMNDLEGLECLPEWLFYNNPNLSKLEILRCPKLIEIPDGLHTLNSLEELTIWFCPNLKSIGNDNSPLKSHGIIRSLRIGMCRGLMELPGQMIDSWVPSLEKLCLWDLSSLKNLPMVIGCIRKSTRLTNLVIMGVPEFIAAPSINNSWSFGNLRESAIDASVGWSSENSGAIKETVEGMLEGCSNNSLTYLTIIGKKDWESIPESIRHLTALSELTLENFGVEELPEWFGNLSSLASLSLTGCNKLRRLPSGDSYEGLKKLQYLHIQDCPKLLNIDSEWLNKPHLDIIVDGHSIKYGINSAGALVKGPPPASSSGAPVVELHKESFAATEKKPGVDIPIKESSSILDAVISKISTADLISSLDSEYNIEQQFADEVVEEAILGSDMSVTVSGLDSHLNVESESCGEAQAGDEITIVKDVEKPSDEIQETVISSTNAAVGRSDTETVLFEEEQLYSIVEKDNHLELKFDDQVILIGDCPSPSTIPPVKAMQISVECNLDKLSETSNYPNALILLLQRNKRLRDISHSFFDAMPELRSLDISNTRIRILPSSLFKLSKLKVLLLRNCLCLDTLPGEIGGLVQLEALDLSGTELYQLPDEIGELDHLRRMQLSFYGPDDESEYEHLPSRLVSPTFLLKLKEMEVLSIMVHPEDHRWTETSACIAHDMSKLEKLSSLQFYFPEVETFEKFIETSSSWKENVLVKFDLTLGQNVKRIGSRVPNEVESLFIQHERCLRYVDGDGASPLLNTALTRVASFYLDHHTKVESLSEFGISNFSELKFCVIRECPKLQTILDGESTTVAFPRLEYLGIFFLWELKHIWMPTPQAGRLKRIFGTPGIPLKNKNFEALRHLIIKTCPKLQFILQESMLQCLAKLEELVVEDCERVEKIIKEEYKKVRKENNFLSGLKKLVLRYLPELVALGNGVCLSKEEISIHGCPKLIFMIQEMQAGKESKAPLK